MAAAADSSAQRHVAAAAARAEGWRTAPSRVSGSYGEEEAWRAELPEGRQADLEVTLQHIVQQLDVLTQVSDAFRRQAVQESKKLKPRAAIVDKIRD